MNLRDLYLQNLISYVDTQNDIVAYNLNKIDKK